MSNNTHTITKATKRLLGKTPDKAPLFPLVLQFTKPAGFWMRAHTACAADLLLPTGDRARKARSAA